MRQGRRAHIRLSIIDPRLLRQSLAEVRDWLAAVGTGVFSSGNYDLRKTIVVTGSPRSGTTWAAQTISSIPGSAVLFEPLHLDRVPLAREAGFSWRTYVRPGTHWPEGERALDAMLRGQVLNSWTGRELRRPRRVSTWIVKFVRANRLLPWLLERFPIRVPLLIVRHPCAVIASQMAASWAPSTGHADRDVLNDFPQIRTILDTIETNEERSAAQWAIDTLVPLSQRKPHGWITVPYEHLVRGSHSFRPVFERWGIEMPSELESRHGVMSRTTTRPENIRVRNPVTAWTEQLTRDQVRRILAVTHAFGLDFYADDPEPDVSRLAQWGGMVASRP